MTALALTCSLFLMGIKFSIYAFLIRDHSFEKAKRATCTQTGSRNKTQITMTTKTVPTTFTGVSNNNPITNQNCSDSVQSACSLFTCTQHNTRTHLISIILYMTCVLDGPRRHLPCHAIRCCFPCLPVDNESDRHYKVLGRGDLNSD